MKKYIHFFSLCTLLLFASCVNINNKKSIIPIPSIKKNNIEKEKTEWIKKDNNVNIKTKIEYFQPDKTPHITPIVQNIERILNTEEKELNPQVSNNGKYLIFTVVDSSKSGTDKFSIQMKILNETGKIILVPYKAEEPSWFPDNEHVAFTYYQNNIPTIAEISIKKSNLISFITTDFENSYSKPNVSSDGRKIAFECKLFGKSYICIKNLNNGVTKLLTPGISPKWSPDGKKIIYSLKDGKYYHLYMIKVKEGKIIKLTDGKGNDLWPCFSPEGNWIVFSSNREDFKHYHLYALNLKNNKLLQLTLGSSDEIQPFWTKDNYIYFVSNAGAPKPLKNKFDYMDIWRLKMNLNFTKK